MIIALIFISLYTIPSIVIAILQMMHIKNNTKPVILNEDDFKIALNYALINQKYKIIESILSGILFILWMQYGISLIYFGDSFLNKLEMVISFLILNLIISLPLEAYKTLVIDKNFGFTKSTPKLFILDFFKNLVLIVFISLILASALIYIISISKFWWLWGFCIVFFFLVIVNILYPILIAPIFNKFTPLSDLNLKNSIEKMMQKVGFESRGIFVMDASKRDGRLNAYFGGLGKSKRVVLFDTLLSKVSKNELLAILGHELAHFKHKDLIKNIVLLGVILFILFFIAGHLSNVFFTNIVENEASTIIILILISPFFMFYFLPLFNYFSRKAEYRADSFGSALTNKADLANALIKLINENKAFPYSHKLHTFFYMSHPPLLDRLKKLEYRFK